MNVARVRSGAELAEPRKPLEINVPIIMRFVDAHQSIVNVIFADALKMVCQSNMMKSDEFYLPFASNKLPLRMANRFANIKLHLIFAFKGHESYVAEENLPRLFAYMAGCLNARGHFAVAVGGRSDHIHILFDYNPTDSISDLVGALKSASNRFIHDNNLSPFKVRWQNGYACFSVTCHDYEKVRRYIQNQKEHHTHTTVRDELRNMLQISGMKFDENYLFD